MKKFSKSFVPGTAVMLFGSEDSEMLWRTVKEVDETRQLIKIEGLIGSFQRNHVNVFSNKKTAEELNDLENFRAEGSSLFEKQGDSYVHVFRDDRISGKERLVRAYRSL